MHLQAYTEDLASRGLYHFTLSEAVTALNVSLTAARAALRRMQEHGQIANPYRGFFVIVPPEYRAVVCLPPEQFVPQLMDHLGLYYYVALLSAAEFHGASHHRPQRFQVMLSRNRRPIECGKVLVQFIARRYLERTPVVERNTPRGRIRIASPEATALELVGYADQCGGLDNVATVLVDLVDVLDPARIVAAAADSPTVWSQRLGFLLDAIDHSEMADALADHVKNSVSVLAPLVRKKSIVGTPRNKRWKLAINAHIEPDI